MNRRGVRDRRNDDDPRLQELSDIFTAVGEDDRASLMKFARDLLNRGVIGSLSNSRAGHREEASEEPYDSPIVKQVQPMPEPERSESPLAAATRSHVPQVKRSMDPEGRPLAPLEASVAEQPAPSIPAPLNVDDSITIDEPTPGAVTGLDMTQTLAAAVGDDDLPDDMMAHTQGGLDVAPLEASDEEEDGVACVWAEKLILRILSTWGDQYYYGLAGLSVYGPDGTPYPLTVAMIHPEPRDLNAMEGYSGDTRTPDKLVDGTNVTTDETHMWLAPATMDHRKPQLVEIGLECHAMKHLARAGRYPVSGIRLWNYNKTVEDTTRGVMDFLLFADDKLVSPDAGFQLRKAPGLAHVDYGQLFLTTEARSTTLTPQTAIKHTARPRPSQLIRLPDHVVSAHPTMLTLTIAILSTYGNPRALSLDGIEVFAVGAGRVVYGDKAVRVGCHPGGDRGLQGLFNHQAWTCDMIKGGVRIDLVFDEPFSLDYIKIYNSTQIAMSSARDIQILADDRIIYEGSLMPAIPTNPTAANSILFTADRTTHEREHDTVVGNFEPPEVSSQWQKNARLPIAPVRFINQHKEVNLPRYMTQSKTKKLPMRGQSAPSSDLLAVVRGKGSINRPVSVNRMAVNVT